MLDGAGLALALWKTAAKSESPLHKKMKAGQGATLTGLGKEGLDGMNHGVAKDDESFMEEDLYDMKKYEGEVTSPDGNVASGAEAIQVQTVQVTPGKAEVVIEKVIPA